MQVNLVEKIYHKLPLTLKAFQTKAILYFGIAMLTIKLDGNFSCVFGLKVASRLLVI